MAISGVGKIADQGLLARTLSNLNPVNKNVAPQAVKEPSEVKRVNEGGAGNAVRAEQPKQTAIARQAPRTMDAVAVNPKAAAAKKDEMEAPAVLSVGLDIKA